MSQSDAIWGIKIAKKIGSYHDVHLHPLNTFSPKKAAEMFFFGYSGLIHVTYPQGEYGDIGGWELERAPGYSYSV